MLRTLTRNDERCSDPSPRPRSFFSDRMPSFPVSVSKKKKKKHRLLLLLLCGFGVVVATFWSPVSLISAGSQRPAAWFLFSLSSFTPGGKEEALLLCFLSQRPWQCERRWWLLVHLTVSSACWRCLLPPHGRVIWMSAGKQRHPTVGARNDTEAASEEPQQPLVEEILQPYTSISKYFTRNLSH